MEVDGEVMKKRARVAAAMAMDDIATLIAENERLRAELASVAKVEAGLWARLGRVEAVEAVIRTWQPLDTGDLSTPPRWGATFVEPGRLRKHQYPDRRAHRERALYLWTEWKGGEQGILLTLHEAIRLFELLRDNESDLRAGAALLDEPPKEPV